MSGYSKSDIIRAWCAEKGAKGGRAGRGEAKRRSPEHYAEISRQGVRARAAKKEALREVVKRAEAEFAAENAPRRGMTEADLQDEVIG